jgi:hypothetical protein
MGARDRAAEPASAPEVGSRPRALAWPGWPEPPASWLARAARTWLGLPAGHDHCIAGAVPAHVVVGAPCVLVPRVRLFPALKRASPRCGSHAEALSWPGLRLAGARAAPALVPVANRSHALRVEEEGACKGR